MLILVLTGFSLALCGATIWALVYKRSTRNVNRVMCTATCLLLILSTMVSEVSQLASRWTHVFPRCQHIIVDSRRVWVGFIRAENAEIYFSDVSKETWKNAIYEFETLIADGVLVSYDILISSLMTGLSTIIDLSMLHCLEECLGHRPADRWLLQRDRSVKRLRWL